MFYLATSLTELPARLGSIFYGVVGPILLLVGLGWLLQRRFALHMDTLRRLCFHFVMPAMMYYSVLTTPLTASDAITVVTFAVVSLSLLAALTYVVARLRRIPPDVRRVMMMTTFLYNSGNYGLPLQRLAFRDEGRGEAAMAYQVFVMIAQSFLTFTVGVLVVSGARQRHWRRNLAQIVRFPPLLGLLAALATLAIRQGLSPGQTQTAERVLQPFWDVIVYVKQAFIPIALLTLGAQLGVVGRPETRYPVTASVVLRLLAGPAIGLGMIYIMGIQGFLAQVLLVSSATPTAVNCMLLCLEFDNHPDYAARAVFYSTLLSPITVTLTIFLAQSGAI